MTADSPHDEDLIDVGSTRRRKRTQSGRLQVFVGVVAVAVVAVIALSVFHHDMDRREPHLSSSTASPSPSVVTPALLQADGSGGCGTFDGDGVLSVAFAIINTGGTGVVLKEVRPVLPLAGLQPLGGAAERPPAGTGCPDVVLRPGDTLADNSGGWIALTFRATISCITPLPIGVDIVYESGGAIFTRRVNPFPDLGAVPAASRGCPTAPALPAGPSS